MDLQHEQFITILNWEKFNPRKDVKNPSWFRMEHSIFFDPDWDYFNGEELLIWVYLLGLASFKNKPTFLFNPKQIANKARVSDKAVLSAILKLQELQCVQITSRTRNVDVTDTSRARIVTDETDGTNETGRDETDGTNETGRDETRHDNLPVETSPQPDQLVEVWNQNCGDLPKVERLSDKRKKTIKARLKETPDLAYWTLVVQRIEQSDFCKGKNQRGWRADFDFLIQSDAHIKVMEGKYDNRTGPAPPGGFKTRNEIINEKNAKQQEAILRGEI